MLRIVALQVVLPLLGLAVALTLVRLLRGPSAADRVVALDLLTTIGIGFAAAYALATSRSEFLDVGIVLALLSFLGTVGFAYYLERPR